MDASNVRNKSEARWTRARGLRASVFRGVASAAVMGLALSACSSVPDAINPVSWYEKTTDFFAGDSQAAGSGMPTVTDSNGENKGLAADPNAPPPAQTPAQGISSAPSGLAAAQVAGNYATPAIERQGAPTNVLTQNADVASASPAPMSAPVPAPRPTVPVMSAPSPSMPAPMPAQIAEGSMPPPMPAMPGDAPQAMTAPTSNAPMTPPAPFEFPPTNAMAAYGTDGFETVVITADGMESMAEPAPQPLMSLQGAPSQATRSSSAKFPSPGATTTPVPGPVNVGGMLRVATIHFANNAANLDQRDRSILGAVIQLQKERGGRVVVVGHASSRTKDMDYIKHQMVNFEISMNRAATIGTTLKTMGLPAEVLEIQAVSDAQPLFIEVMPSGEAGNRRVELYLAGAAT